MSTQLGYPGLVKQPSEREYIPGEGWETVEEWHGSQGAVDGFISQLLQFNYRLRRFRVEGATYGVEARIPDAQDGSAPAADPDDDQTVTWELIGNDLEKDLFDAPKYIALSGTEKIVLDELRQTRNFENQNLSVINPNTDGERFKDLIEKGAQAYPVSQYVLRRNATVSPDWPGTFAIANVNKFYATTAALIAAENVSASLKFALPDGMWLKRTPTVSEQRNGRVEAVNEWWHADTWSEALHEEAV